MQAEATMTLQGFIETQLKERSMSGREFAVFLGVSHTVVYQALKPDYVPSLEFLVALARGTGMDLCSIVALVYPDLARRDARAYLIAQRIAALPASEQDAIDALLTGFLQRK